MPCTSRQVRSLPEAHQPLVLVACPVPSGARNTMRLGASATITPAPNPPGKMVNHLLIWAWIALDFVSNRARRDSGACFSALRANFGCCFRCQGELGSRQRRNHPMNENVTNCPNLQSTGFTRPSSVALHALASYWLHPLADFILIVSLMPEETNEDIAVE